MIIRLAAFAAIALLVVPAFAVQAPHDHEKHSDDTRRLPYILESSLSTREDAAPTGPLDAFVARHGGEWWGRVAPESGRALLVSGSGLAVAPGLGNELPADAPVDLGLLEERVRQIIAANPELLGPKTGELRLSQQRSAILDAGRLAFVDFDLAIGGVRVEGASVFARIRHGNVIQLGTRLLGGSAAPSEPTLTAEDAIARMFEHVGGRRELDSLFGDAELFYLPLEESGTLRYELVWKVAFRRSGETETWTAHVDAHDGRILEFFDGNHYSGLVDGGVFPRSVNEEEIVLPFPLVDVTGAGTTDMAGQFLYEGGTVFTGLDGAFFTTDCENCVNPPQANATASSGLGALRLGVGGPDETGNGVSTRSERMTHFHLNKIRLIAKKWLDVSWLDNTITSNVNIDNTCNAFYNGTVNFYRSGGGCNNTGEISDVIQHEWGHGIDNNTRGGDSATGEGTADHVAFIFHRDPIIGPYFRTTGAGVRNVDKETTSKGLLTWSNVVDKCNPAGFGCSGPRGMQCHCEGEIYGQTGWDLANLLVDRYGFQTGWQEYEKLFYKSLPQAGTYAPNQSDSIYDAYLATDDDDGNLANGTPNGDLIYDAFNLHEIAGAPVGASPACTRPAEPSVTASADCGGVTLSWDPVPNAVEYRVLKNFISPEKAYYLAGTTTDTSFVDDEVRPGIDYYYLVEAVTAEGCASSIENVVTQRGPDYPVLNLSEVTFDDIPAGNRSGTIDPGESVDLFMTMENLADIAGTGVIGTIVSETPGVTVEIGEQSFPDTFGLDFVSNVQGFRIAIDETVACGAPIDLTLTMSDDSTCSAASQRVRLTTGVDEPRETDTFESDLGWTYDAGASTATAGDWTRGIPDATSAQPGADSGDEGELCWFTAPNGGGEGSDDVDGGEVVLLSPLFDLSALPAATLSYTRWFYNRDIGDDAGDFFIVEASDNDGASWITVEELGDDVSAPGWNEVRVDLGALIALTDSVRFRVRVSDGTADSDLIEGAFDHFRITEPVCDDTPPCFIPPSFAGLDSALPGNDCAETILDWGSATTSCENAEITYSIYRSTDPVFTPAGENLVATGVAATSYVDTLLAPGATYHYIVRADDSRSGQDANLERRDAIAPTSPDTKSPIFDGLVSAAAGDNCGETQLDWGAALETCSTPVVYKVYRSTTPGFVPSDANLVAETTDTSLVDAAITPNSDVYYVVRAIDQAGVEDQNLVERGVTAKVLDEELTLEDFEAGAGGWLRDGLNDATTGLWELGDPVETSAQPGDCPSGTSCWATGLTGPGLGDNDVDGGTTTLLSGLFSLVGAEEPAVRYLRYYSNDTGSTPGTDTWTVEISNDDGASWTVIENTNESDSGLVFREVEFPTTGVLEPTSQMRMRFTASDLNDGSLVEAVVDDFRTVDLVGGCDECGTPPVVEQLFVDKDAADVLLDWSGDPVVATRYKVYTFSGADFSDQSLLGTSTEKNYRHVEGTRVGQLTAYRVAAVDACGQEGPLP